MTWKRKKTNTHNSCLIVSFHTGILFIIPVILALSQSYSRLHINMCICVTCFFYLKFISVERARTQFTRSRFKIRLIDDLFVPVLLYLSIEQRTKKINQIKLKYRTTQKNDTQREREKKLKINRKY